MLVGHGFIFLIEFQSIIYTQRLKSLHFPNEKMQNMFFTHFEIKAFKDLNKTDRHLLVIFNLATFINNYTLFKIYYFSFSHSKQLIQTLHTHLRPQYPSQGHSLGYTILSQFSSSPLPFQWPEIQNFLNICMRLLQAILLELNLCESTWSYTFSPWN